jgi:biopolymer transport protein TolR
LTTEKQLSFSLGARMAIAIRNEGGKVNSAINVTPMVDVMLVLLIIFMVVTPMLTPGQNVQLARTDHPLLMPDADKDDALLVAINREGQVFFGTEKIGASDLALRIRDRIAGHNDKPVFVKADARCRYGTVVEVVDNVRAAGVSELGLLTEQRGQQRADAHEVH